VKQQDILALIGRMADELRKRMDIDDRTVMVGIHTGGAWIARLLHKKLGIGPPLGTLDISFYRDDFTRIGMNPQVKPSELPFTLDGRNIILVDDVLHTGRTVRAAMNELFDYGRPASIVLATLVERPGRELPIEANVVGLRMELAAHEHVKLSGPDPLNLEVKKSS
jgi:pyrimidine operon attenuation protein/uracil phosphoribosyltransferase